MRRRANPLAEFLAKTQYVDGHLIWQGRIDPDTGYGRVSWQGSTRNIHMVIWMLTMQQALPPGHEVDHLCRVRACVDFLHLECVTGEENARRAQLANSFQAKKLACPAGHAYDETNTYRSAGKRMCKECRRDAVRRYRAKRT